MGPEAEGGNPDRINSNFEIASRKQYIHIRTSWDYFVSRDLNRKVCGVQAACTQIRFGHAVVNPKPS